MRDLESAERRHGRDRGRPAVRDPFAVLGPHLTPKGWVDSRLRARRDHRARAHRGMAQLLAELERRKDDFFEALMPVQRSPVPPIAWK